MLGINDFGLFVFSCILLSVTPGQDTLYIVGRSVAQGRRAGILSVLGVMTGVLVHTLLAALGLSVVLATSSLAFAAVKYTGAVYLVWIGVGLWMNRNHSSPTAGPPAVGASESWRIYRQGVLTNVLNPKVALFFLSFLPQFVSPQASPVFFPFLVLGLVFFIIGTVWCLLLALGAERLSARFCGHTSADGALKKVAGALFIGLGLRLALSHAR